MNVLLAIDPAKCSGWAIFVDGKYHSSGSGELNRYERDTIVETVEMLAGDSGEVAIAMETWSLHGKWSNLAKMSVCEQAGRWLDSIEVYALRPRVVRVRVDEWRRGLFGRGNMKSEAAKAMAMRQARGVLGRHAVDDNEAEAVCIAAWALCDDHVRGLLGIGRAA